MSRQTHVIKIEPKGKYVMIFRHSLPVARANQVALMLTDWMKSDAQFMILDDDTRLVKVTEQGEFIDLADSDGQ